MQIELIKRLSAHNGLNILVIGVFHGDEPQGEFLIRKYISEQKLNPKKNSIFYIPRLNQNNERKNKNGVDLNRNFPTKNWELGDVNSPYFGGFAPASEDEVKFVVDLIETNQFDAIVSIHAPFMVVNYDFESRKTIFIAKKISEFLGYPIKADIGYPTPGSFGTYAGIERKIPTITIEVDENISQELLYPNFLKLFKFLEDDLE